MSAPQRIRNIVLDVGWVLVRLADRDAVMSGIRLGDHETGRLPGEGLLERLRGLTRPRAVVLLKSLVPGLPDPHLGWLTLAMSSTLAGNLIITGSVANIIVVERARPAVHIGFREYFRLGLPLTAVTLAWGILWLSLVR
ncbi:MAG: hypothetical protein JO184_17795, partial [Gammaproteobacteria bacterium]|nr:hypothetical protein [Gammaproteobacteria bacterium]